MTVIEYNELYDQLCYGHEAEILYNGNKYFFEWEDFKITIYSLTNKKGVKIAEITEKDKFSIVNKLFNLPIWNNAPLNQEYNNIEIIDIE